MLTQKRNSQEKKYKLECTLHKAIFCTKVHWITKQEIKVIDRKSWLIFFPFRFYLNIFSIIVRSIQRVYDLIYSFRNKIRSQCEEATFLSIPIKISFSFVSYSSNWRRKKFLTQKHQKAALSATFSIEPHTRNDRRSKEYKKKSLQRRKWNLL